MKDGMELLEILLKNYPHVLIDDRGQFKMRIRRKIT